MNDLLERQKQEIEDKRCRKKRWQRFVSVLAAATVFVTTYSLILPAITLERDMAAVDAAAAVEAAERGFYAPNAITGYVPGTSGIRAVHSGQDNSNSVSFNTNK